MQGSNSSIAPGGHGADKVGGQENPADTPIKLSVCIPTYNRATFIGETLESILRQGSEHIEVVVMDGASTDNTTEVVASYQQRHANLVYHRGQANRGVDRDMAAAVELARGEYCWLMSSDDLIAPGAMEIVLAEIASGADIYFCNVTLCDIQMRPIKSTRYMSPHRQTDVFDFSDRVQFINYLSLATSNNALFCYMSNLVFRREGWLAVGFNSRFDRTGYAHVYTLLSSVKSRGVVKYVSAPLVWNRGDNDSFSSQGLEKRYLLDFDGYQLLADQLFADDQVLREAFLHVMTREHPWYRLAKLRASMESDRQWERIISKLSAFGYRRWDMFLVGLMGRFPKLVKLALNLNNRYARSSWLHWLREKL